MNSDYEAVFQLVCLGRAYIHGKYESNYFHVFHVIIRSKDGKTEGPVSSAHFTSVEMSAAVTAHEEKPEDIAAQYVIPAAPTEMRLTGEKQHCNDDF